MARFQRKGDHPYRHESSVGSDHSGAHVRGTSHHNKHAGNPKDGLTRNEGGSAAVPFAGNSDPPDQPMPGGLPTGGMPGGGFSGGGASM